MSGKPRSKVGFKEWDALFAIKIGLKKIDTIAVKVRAYEIGSWERGISLQVNQKLYSNQSFLMYIQVKILEKVDDLRATVLQLLKFLIPDIGSMPK
jgi:hypothetical protein